MNIFFKFKVADFYLPKYKLIIEIDGEYHDTLDQQCLDKKRTKDLEHKGKKVIRFTNDKVLQDTSNKVFNKIIKKVCPQVEHLLKN